MSETLEKQFVVSRRRRVRVRDRAKPWKEFDSRAQARIFVRDKEAKSRVWEYWIDPVTRGPRA